MLDFPLQHRMALDPNGVVVALILQQGHELWIGERRIAVAEFNPHVKFYGHFRLGFEFEQQLNSAHFSGIFLAGRASS